MPVHVVIGLVQPLKAANVSSTVHLAMPFSVFQKSFFSDWVKFMQEYPSYDYNQQEEQVVLGQGFEVSGTTFARLDPGAIRFLTERMMPALEPSPSGEATSPAD